MDYGSKKGFLPPLIQKRWGEALLILVGILAAYRVQLDSTPGHYRMAVSAAKALWNGETAYGIPWIGNLFLYSPSCAMFFYGPFAVLPEKWGLLAFTATSALMYYWGALRFGTALIGRDRLNLLWVIMLSHFYSGLVAHKTEIFSTGLFLLGCTWIIEGRRRYLSAFLLSMLANWKLQPLPALGLVSLVLLILKKDKGWWIACAVSFAFWAALPFGFQSFDYMAAAYARWLGSLSEYSGAQFDFYDNLFAFLRNNFGILMSYHQARTVSAVAGLLIAALVAGWAYLHKFRPAHDSRRELGEAILLAVAAGFAFTTLFSPLQQINAYILFSPTILIAVKHFHESRTRVEKTTWAILLSVTWIILSIAYSELIPTAPREVIRHSVVRAAGVSLLTAAVLLKAFLNQPRARVRI